MDQTGFYNRLRTILSKEQIFCKEPMSRHTTFRAGGPADYYLTPRPEQAADLLQLCRRDQVPYQVVGNGSNLLVGDQGIRGAVIAFAKPAAQITVSAGKVAAGAGALLSQAAAAALRAGLGGMEFAAGIPGSVGGAVVMNAGAYGGEIKDILTRAVVLDQEGKQLVLENKELEFAYRHSCVSSRQLTVLEAEFALQPKPREEIQALMDDLKSRRMEKQPLEYPSAGSTFKRPEGYYAGKLIMDAGLRGFQVGGAKVSEKHCGFVVNTGGATAADVCQLMREVADRVWRQFGVVLEPEVKRIGIFE